MTETVESSTPDSPPSLQSGRRFADYGLAADVLEALGRMGIEIPTPIQEACIPSILEGKDVVGKAETGTGKTIGFGAPLVGKIDTNRVAVQALVLTPTRELAQQVAGVIELLGAGRGLGVVLVVGGVHASEQILKLRSGSQVVVGTPGRVLDFLRDRTLSLVWCETVVLDEADRMLDMGFIDDVSAIIEKVPEERQTLLFSATVPPAIQTLLRRYMKDPQMFSTSKGLSTVAEIKQRFVESELRDKFKALQKVLDAHAGGTAIIFCNTRRQAIDLDRMLWGHGYSAGALHGEQEQDVRFRILESFRRGEIRILVATDVASRGLDIEDVACVINYEIPDEPEAYVHRIGRTGRAQKAGEAISIVSGREWGSWQRILRDTGFPVERMGPERVRPTGGSSRGGPGRGDERHGDRGSSSGRGGPRGRRMRGGGGAREGRGERRQSPGGGGGRGAPVGTQHQNGGGEDRSHSKTIFETSGERFVAQETDHPDPVPTGENVPPAQNAAREGASTASHAARGMDAASPDGERRRSRRRGRRGRGGGSSTSGGGSENREQPRHPGAVPPPEPRDEPEAGYDDEPVESEPATKEGVESATKADWSAERPRAPRPPRIKLEELNDEFLKTEYFDVDYTLIERAGVDASRPPAAGGPERRHGGGGGGGGAGGRRPEGGGHGPRHGGHGSHGGRQHRPSQHSPAPGAGSQGGAPRGVAGPGQHAERPGDGQRRRRRRRRGGGGGGGGGGQRHGGGSGGGGGAPGAGPSGSA